MAPVRCNPQRTCPDPLNGIDYINNFEDADLLGRPGQQKSTMLAPLGGYQSTSAERLHDFGEVTHGNQRCSGNLLVGLRVIYVASQPDDSPKRVLDSVRQHLDMWMIISIYSGHGKPGEDLKNLRLELREAQSISALTIRTSAGAAGLQNRQPFRLVVWQDGAQEKSQMTQNRFRGLVALAGCILVVLGTLRVGNWPRTASAQAAAPQAANDGKLRIIIFGAHPDDAEYRGAGVAMKWARLGHHVKLVSATNGDIGHWQIAGGPLAQRRLKEVLEVGRRLGVSTEVLDIHDGEILPTLENRRMITRLIRQWNADIVIANRPNDYHPDHRYTSILVQDSAFMVTVPFFAPDVPWLKKNPVFLYAADRFQRPNPFTADIAIDIDDVIEPTLDALMVMESQIQEGGAIGNASLYPADAAGRQRRTEQARAETARRYAMQATTYRDALVKAYGEERGLRVRYAQAFEVCEYGRQPSREDLKQLFPF